MKIQVRFLGIAPELPREFSEIEAEEGTTLAVLMSSVGDRFGCAGGLPEGVLVASEGRMLHDDDMLKEGQQVTFAGSIIGG